MYFNRHDIIQAHFWWNVGHHTGQWSPEYRRQCRISRYYTPGASENGPDNENAQEIYDQLCERAGNKCSCSDDD